MENNQDNKCNKCIFCLEKGKHTVFIRWVLGIIILVVVFSFGIKLGKFSSFINQGYYGYGQGYGSPMMQGYSGFPRGMMWSDSYGR
ncbi:MAG: hypothetical protein AAB396_02895 [Patescibacteria group bacterium]